MTRSNGLPRRVYIKHGAYYYVDMARKWHRLGSVRDGLPAMYRALADMHDRAERTVKTPAVISAWLESRRPGWSASQRRNMERIAADLMERLAEFEPAQIKTPICAELLSSYHDRPRTHNIYRNVLSQVLAHAALLGLREGHNPVDNVRGLSTPGRRRIVTDAEIDSIKTAATQTRQHAGGQALVRMIDLALITGQRIGDLISMRWQDVTADGLLIEQGKTGTRLCIAWTPALRQAIDACAEGTERIGHLLKTRSGGPYTYAGMRSAWDRACAAAGVTDLHIHDLRGRAGVDMLRSDGLESARALLGHQTQRMTAHYTGGKHVPIVKPAR